MLLATTTLRPTTSSMHGTSILLFKKSIKLQTGIEFACGTFLSFSVLPPFVSRINTDLQWAQNEASWDPQLTVTI